LCFFIDQLQNAERKKLQCTAKLHLLQIQYLCMRKTPWDDEYQSMSSDLISELSELIDEINEVIDEIRFFYDDNQCELYPL